MSASATTEVTLLGGPKHRETYAVSKLGDYITVAEIDYGALRWDRPDPFTPPQTKKIIYEMVKIGFFGRYMGAVYMPVNMDEQERAEILANELLSDFGKRVVSSW